jgi:hypothetical protein
MRFLFATFGLGGVSRFAASTIGRHNPELPTFFDPSLDKELKQIFADNAAAVVDRLPEIIRWRQLITDDDYSKVLGYYGLNPTNCVIRFQIGYVPLCTRPENYVSDPAPSLNYGIHFRKWNKSSCGEVAAKIYDRSGKVFLIEVKLFQPAVVNLEWLTGNKCQHKDGIVYETVKDGLWKNMAESILSLENANLRLSAWIRFLVKVAFTASDSGEFVTQDVIELFRLMTPSMVAVTVLKPPTPEAAMAGFTGGSGDPEKLYVPGTGGN